MILSFVHAPAPPKKNIGFRLKLVGREDTLSERDLALPLAVPLFERKRGRVRVRGSRERERDRGSKRWG